MSSLRVAMDAGFWDLNVASAQALDGAARAVPGEPAPLGLARASRTARPQQLSFLRNALPLGIVPSLAPTSEKALGSFALHALLLGPSSSNWWMGLVGQFRPRKLITSIKNEVTSGDEIDFLAFKDIAKHFLDKSLYAVGLFSQLSLMPDTSVLFNLERHGERKEHRLKAMLHHKLADHDLTLEAAWPELFVDRNGTYWDVPSSISLDLASLVSDSGLRYRLGLHKNRGKPEAHNSISGDIPSVLMPGICAKAAFSYEKSWDLWRDKEKKSLRTRILEKDSASLSSYDIRLKEPHAAISGIIGGTYAAWLGGKESLDSSSKALPGDGKAGAGPNLSSKRRYSLSADLFGSLCYTFQKGKFKNDFNDLTRVDVRLDINSASAFLKGASHLFSDFIEGPVERKVNPIAAPRLNMILQQQVAGPIVFRMDSRVSLTSPCGKHIPHIEDVMYSLSYSLRALQSGKILAWYSPRRKEAMVELRLFEF